MIGPNPAPDDAAARELCQLHSSMLEVEAEKAIAQENFRGAIDLLGQAITLATADSAGDARFASLHRLHAAAFNGAGMHGRARAEARTAADCYRKAGNSVGEARAMYQEAVACFQLGDYTAGLGIARAGLLVIQETPENDDIGNLQLILGSILVPQGEWSEALNLFHDALASFRRSQNQWGMARAHGHLAVVYKNLGRLDQSIELSEKAEEIAARLGHSTAGFALNQGIARYWKGDHEGAQTCFMRSLNVSHRNGDTLRHTRALIALGRLLTERGQTGESRRLLERAERLAEEKQYRREIVLAEQCLGDVDFRAGDLDRAAERWERAETLSQRIAPGGDLHAAIWTRQSALELRRGDLPRALELGTSAANAAMSTGIMHDRAMALIARACAAQALSCREEAHQGFADGLNLMRSAGLRFQLADSLTRVGHMLVADARSESREEGFRLLEDAAEQYGLLSESDLMAEVFLDTIELRLHGGELDPAQAGIRKLRLGLAGEGIRLPDSLGERLASLEETLSRRMGEIAASQDNPFRLLERSGHPHDQHSREPEADILRSLLDSTGSDRGFLALAPTLGAGPIRVVACHAMKAREAEGIARKLWLSSPGTAALAEMPGISVSPGWDRRFAGSPLYEENAVGACLWVRIAREGRESALVYCDRLEREAFRPYGQWDLSLATSLTHLLALALDNLELRRILQDPVRRRGVITQDPRMLQILESVGRIQGDLEIILLQGETGTGKNHLTRAIFAGSDRPFNEMRCTDVTETLVESELFGHVPGAFTDAKAQRQGLLAQGRGGIVFIDEIDKTSLKFQSRLLGVIGEHVFRPVGGSYQRLEARIVCASAKDLRREAEAGKFLAELYYRLMKFSFTLPPLRERRGDIPLLAEHFLQEARKARKRDNLRLTPEALRLLISYPWPGNVRHLEHEIDRAATFADMSGLIGPEIFSDEIQEWRHNLRSAPSGGNGDGAPHGDVAPNGAVPRNGDAPGGRIVDAVEALERRMVQSALARHGGVKSRAARELGLTRRGLDLKMRRLGTSGGESAATG